MPTEITLDYITGIIGIKFIILKTLFIIRHAKSNQNFLGSDFERPLNDRGLTDAPTMAKRLLDKKIKIDAFIASPALRAKTTATLFAKEYSVLNDEIILVDALYHAPKEVFYAVINALPNELNSVAIFSHNPGITYFVDELIDNVTIDNMPTCGVFAVQINCKTWSEFKQAKKELLFFDYPKNV
jgi:phosphohistidine phosphatase